jgi:hypothetical protein
MAPISFWPKNQPKKIDPTLKAQKWPKSAQMAPKKMLMISKTSVFCINQAPNLP